MRNLFDQYKSEENRLSHALATALHEDKLLLASFVKRYCPEFRPPQPLTRISTQQLPGELEDGEGNDGIPDIWIYNDAGSALLIEAKISARVEPEQIRNHLKTADRRGFSDAQALVLHVNGPPSALQKLPNGSNHAEWKSVYEWARNQKKSDWAARLANYMEIADSKHADSEYLREGTLTKFSGVPFDKEHPYSYLEAKRLLKLLMGEIRKRKILSKELHLDLAAPGASAIKGKDADWVWDFLLFQDVGDEKFTQRPHVTFSFQRDRLVVHLTLPHALKATHKEKFRDFANFQNTINKFVNQLCSSKVLTRNVDGVVSYASILQRHYLHRTQPIHDATLEFDLASATTSTAKSEVKKNSHWLETMHEVFFMPKKPNIQVAIGVSFVYGHCGYLTKSGTLIEKIEQTLLAMSPLIKNR